jgi:hypothetical protein
MGIVFFAVGSGLFTAWGIKTIGSTKDALD